MSSWQYVCEVMSRLPGTELDVEVEHPAWRVRGAPLARRNPMMRVPDEESIRAANGELIAVRVFDATERQLLLDQHPETFFITPHWQTSPSVLVWLERADDALLRELLIDAWRGRAPKRLIRAWEARADNWEP